MKLKRIKYWFIASLCLFLVIPSEPTLAQALLQPQWEYDITNGGKSRTSSHSIESVTDAMGNQSMIVTKVDDRHAYIDSIDAKTGELRWSMPSDDYFVLSEDGYMFIFHYNQVIAKHVYSGQVIWTASLPEPSKKFSYYSWRENAFPKENGSLYLVVNSSDSKSTLYHYDSKGQRSKKFTLSHVIEQIAGEIIISKKYSDHPDSYIHSLSTGKKISMISNGKDYYSSMVLSDNTLLQYNIEKNKLILNAYNAAGKKKWSKQLPYLEYTTDIVALKDRFLFVDAKNKRIRLYTSAGKLITEKNYLPVPSNYNRYWKSIDMAQDGTSFMFTVKQNGQDEIIIMDTSNLNVLFTYKRSEFNFDKDYLFLNNMADLYVLTDEGQTLFKNQLSKTE
nr:hypothetical protein [Paenibacillus xylanexedens]